MSIGRHYSLTSSFLAGKPDSVQRGKFKTGTLQKIGASYANAVERATERYTDCSGESSLPRTEYAETALYSCSMQLARKINSDAYYLFKIDLS